MKRTKHTQKWLDALRSGEYGQTHATIERDGKYCCIGVAALLVRKSVHDELSYQDAKDAMGLSDKEMWHCVHMNDGVEGLERHTFPQIADEIEKMLDAS